MDFTLHLCLRLGFIWAAKVIFAQELSYKYDFHNVLLDHFATKSLQLNLACKGLTTDIKRSGRIVINLYCERRPFEIKIVAPTPISCKDSDSSEFFRIYLNVRSHFLKDQEVLDLSDPLFPTKKRLNLHTPANTIDDTLQSYAQLLTTGPMALLEYTPGATVPHSTCQGHSGNALFVEMEYVLVSDIQPTGLESFKFTRCPALGGFIPTGLLCDQFSGDRPLGCPVEIDSNPQSPSPATGQDRRDLDCHPLVFGQQRDKMLEGVLDGSVPIVGSAMVARVSTHLFVVVLLTLHHNFVVYCLLL